MFASEEATKLKENNNRTHLDFEQKRETKFMQENKQKTFMNNNDEKNDFNYNQ